MKLGRVESPAGVGGAALNTTSFVGSASTAGLTAIRPAKPVVCVPAAVMAPVNGTAPSVNNGSCGLPLVNDVTVAVADAELIALTGPPLSTCTKLPDGLEKVRPVEPSARRTLKPASERSDKRPTRGAGSGK